MAIDWREAAEQLRDQAEKYLMAAEALEQLGSSSVAPAAPAKKTNPKTRPTPKVVPTKKPTAKRISPDTDEKTPAGMMTALDAATALNLAASTLCNLVKTGKLTLHKVGHRAFYPAAEVQALRAERAK